MQAEAAGFQTDTMARALSACGFYACCVCIAYPTLQYADREGCTIRCFFRLQGVFVRRHLLLHQAPVSTKKSMDEMRVIPQADKSMSVEFPRTHRHTHFGSGFGRAETKPKNRFKKSTPKSNTKLCPGKGSDLRPEQMTEKNHYGENLK